MFFFNKLLKLFLITFVFWNCNVCFAKNIFIPFKKNEHNFNIKLSKEDELIFKQIKKDISNKKFSNAFSKASKIKDAINKEMVQTFITAEGFKEINVLNHKNFLNLLVFNEKYNYLPCFDLFHTKIERYYTENSNVKYEEIKDYFNKYKPKKASTYIKFLKQEDDYIFENFTGEELEEKKEKLNQKIINVWLNFKRRRFVVL